MRVLHIGNEMAWRGGENQIRLLVEGLKPLGAESFIAYPAKSRALERFQNVCQVVPLPTRSPFDPRSVSKLVRFCRDMQIDLIDAQSSGGMSLALAVKKRLPHLALVVHRRVAHPIKTNWLSKRKYLSPLVDKYVCISSAIGEILAEYGVDKNKIITVLSAVEEGPYVNIDRDKVAMKLRKQYDLASDTVLIGNASALTAEKGYHELLSACRILQERQIPFHCFIAGDGALEKELKQLCANGHLQNSITFLGRIAAIPEFLTALDILVVPSHKEGLGTILLEGAFAKCALIGTRAGGIPEIIKPGETGLLVEKGDAKALAVAIEQLIVDSNMREKFVKASLEYVREKFSLEQMVSGNWRVYREITRSRP